jgi:ABC-type lipoprotein release transport system permease subunit
MGLVRGVTPRILLVNKQVELVSGHWPRTGEVLVGRLAATKLGLAVDGLAAGQEVKFEGRKWRISGIFAAAGGTAESEIWCRLDELQQAMKRQDLSLVALQLSRASDFQDVDLFCKERLDLELQAMRQADYIASLHQDYAPVRWLSWCIVALIAGTGVFVGLNTMYGAMVGRISEIAMLQTIGFSRRAAILSIMHEGVMLSMAAALLASLLACLFVNGMAVRFTLEAFRLEVDGEALLIGNVIALLLGVGGTIPPAVRIVRMSVVDSLKAV